jgi:hypothetical protein
MYQEISRSLYTHESISFQFNIEHLQFNINMCLAQLLLYYLCKYLSHIAIIILTNRNISIKFAKEKKKTKIAPV